MGVNVGDYAKELIAQSVVAFRQEPQGSIDPAILKKAYLSTKSRVSSIVCISYCFQSPVQQHDFNCHFHLEVCNGSDPPLSAQAFTIHMVLLDQSFLSFAKLEILTCSNFRSMQDATLENNQIDRSQDPSFVEPYIILDTDALKNLEILEKNHNGSFSGALIALVDPRATTLGHLGVTHPRIKGAQSPLRTHSCSTISMEARQFTNVSRIVYSLVTWLHPSSFILSINHSELTVTTTSIASFEVCTSTEHSPLRTAPCFHLSPVSFLHYPVVQSPVDIHQVTKGNYRSAVLVEGVWAIEKQWVSVLIRRLVTDNIISKFEKVSGDFNHKCSRGITATVTSNDINRLDES
eukprot:Gb_25135 [translate_table: standard]